MAGDELDGSDGAEGELAGARGGAGEDAGAEELRVVLPRSVKRAHGASGLGGREQSKADHVLPPLLSPRLRPPIHLSPSDSQRLVWLAGVCRPVCPVRDPLASSFFGRD